jgi:hypothetical protein
MDSSGEILNDAWEWDGATWTSLALATSPPARFGAALALLNDGLVLFGGGDLGGALLHDSWSLTGGQWTQLFPTMYPSDRQYHAMATLAGELVLVGGSADDLETWLLGAPTP